MPTQGFDSPAAHEHKHTTTMASKNVTNETILRHIVKVEAQLSIAIELLQMHTEDPETIADLQRRLNESQKALRELQAENYLENKYKKQ